jgi:hypothetical protein
MADVVDQIADLKKQLLDQQHQITQQTHLLQQLEAKSTAVSAAPEQSTRRDAFRKLAVGAAGAVVAGGAASLLHSSPAAAIDGGNIVIGNTTQTAQHETAVLYNGSPAGSSIFTVTDSATGIGPSLSPNSAIAAWCSGLRNIALSGYSTNNRGVGIYGSSELGVGIMAVGEVQANVQLVAAGLPGPERTTSHNQGELACDSTGELWFSVGGGNPGTWRKLSGPKTAGALHILPEPLRAFDSRSGAKLAATSTTTVGVSTGRNGLGVSVAAVPATATAALVNVTLTGTVGSFGFVQAYSAALIAPPATSVMNWSSPDENIANEITVALNPTAQLKLTIGGGATHVIVDVVGYYR